MLKKQSIRSIVAFRCQTTANDHNLPLKNTSKYLPYITVFNTIKNLFPIIS